jgi:site-specific DNA-adenine methylase
MLALKPFFTYFGGKYRAAPHYPKPRYGTIVEPFAGSAGYSLRYPEKNVVLVERDPILVNLWRWLTTVSRERVESLPVEIENVDLLDIEQEARHLIGFWLNKGSNGPRKTPSKWMRAGTHSTSFWGETIRNRIATQLESIRHWTVIDSSYDSVLNHEATWYIDPPYQAAGRAYRFHDIDYTALGTWCRNLKGQVIVCEAYGATWLPFQPFRTIKANESNRGKKVSHEVIWTNGIAEAAEAVSA